MKKMYSVPDMPTKIPMHPVKSLKSSISETIDILENEMACVIRAKCCDRQCEKCDLVRNDSEIINAYKRAIEIIRRYQSIKEMINS